jgi:hypothetical protein
MFVYFPPGTEMFYFPGCASNIKYWITRFYLVGFPHSDISGSKIARHLPGAYRCHAASFIAFSSQGIHHTPLNFPLGNLKTAFVLLPLSSGLGIRVGLCLHVNPPSTDQGGEGMQTTYIAYFVPHRWFSTNDAGRLLHTILAELYGAVPYNMLSHIIRNLYLRYEIFKNHSSFLNKNRFRGGHDNAPSLECGYGRCWM